MDKPVPRQWDPAAPSLLWAHAIRREHIHLVNQLDSTRADHTSTLDTIDKLQTRVEDLHQRADLIRTTCEQVNARCNTLIHDVERQMLAVLGRLAVLEAENTQLQKRLDRQESDCAAQAAESTRAIQGLLAQEKVLDARVGDIHSRSGLWASFFLLLVIFVRSMANLCRRTNAYSVGHSCTGFHAQGELRVTTTARFDSRSL